MDLTAALNEFLDDVLGATSAYGLTHVDETRSTAEAAAVIRLRLRLYRDLLESGWTAPAGLAEQMAADEQLMTEADDEPAVVPAVAPEPRHPVPHPPSGSDNRKPQPDPRVELEQMRQALESRAVIEQAKGIAMERFSLTADTAWSWLVRTSQQQNVKLRFVAQELVASASAKLHLDGDGSRPTSGHIGLDGDGSRPTSGRISPDGDGSRPTSGRIGHDGARSPSPK